MVTCEPDESSLPYVIEMLGDECIMFASDYPHWDGAWPHASSELFEHNRGRMSDTSLARVAGGQRPPVLRPAVEQVAPAGPTGRSGHGVRTRCQEAGEWLIGVDGHHLRAGRVPRTRWSTVRRPDAEPAGHPLDGGLVGGPVHRRLTQPQLQAGAVPAAGRARAARGWTWTVMRIGARPPSDHGPGSPGGSRRQLSVFRARRPGSVIPMTTKAPRPSRTRPRRSRSIRPGPAPVKAREPGAAGGHARAGGGRRRPSTTAPRALSPPVRWAPLPWSPAAAAVAVVPPPGGAVVVGVAGRSPSTTEKPVTLSPVTWPGAESLTKV